MLKKQLKLKKRHGRIRKKVVGSAERPRLAVRRSLKNIYVQVIDDTKAHTLVSCSSLEPAFVKQAGKESKKNSAEKLGQYAAEKIKKKNIKAIAFDRGGYKYHGRIKAFAESLRQAGIDF